MRGISLPISPQTKISSRLLRSSPRLSGVLGSSAPIPVTSWIGWPRIRAGGLSRIEPRVAEQMRGRGETWPTRWDGFWSQPSGLELRS